MRIALRRVIGQWRSILTVSTGTTLLAAALSYIGGLQSIELSIYDVFMRLRPPESGDDRVVLVTIDEADLGTLQQWPISDRDLARATEAIAAQQPSAIGLNLYRNLPVQPGHAQWLQTARNTPNLIGAHKLGVPRVEAPEVLQNLGRIAFSDLPIDPDRRQRRAMLSALSEEFGALGVTNGASSISPELPDNIHLSFAMRLSWLYLERHGLSPDLSEPSKKITWGKATFRPLLSYDGGYSYGSTRGYQILIDYRGLQPETFPSKSLSDVLNGRVSADWFRDKIVLIGTTAASLDTRIHTPFSYGSLNAVDSSSSLYVHANIISQIISAVLDGREFLQAARPTHKLLWIWGWTIAFNTLCVAIALSNDSPTARSNNLASYLALGVGLLSIAAIASGFFSFLSHLWLPTFAPIVSGVMASTIVIVQQRNSFARLASTDGLTQLANRRYFDEFLDRCWQETRSRRELSLLLCDVDFFKRYNDTYGHQAGDTCLSSVALAMSNSVRGNDLVARYGGEEFAVIMPASSLEVAEQVAAQMCQAVRDLDLEHSASDAAPRVTISCGIAATSLGTFHTPEDLIEEADRALYLAKKEGRNCYRVLVSLDSDSSPQPTTDLPRAPEPDDDAQPA